MNRYVQLFKTLIAENKKKKGKVSCKKRGTIIILRTKHEHFSSVQPIYSRFGNASFQPKARISPGREFSESSERCPVRVRVNTLNLNSCRIYFNGSISCKQPFLAGGRDIFYILILIWIYRHFSCCFKLNQLFTAPKNVFQAALSCIPLLLLDLFKQVFRAFLLALPNRNWTRII